MAKPDFNLKMLIERAEYATTGRRTLLRGGTAAAAAALAAKHGLASAQDATPGGTPVTVTRTELTNSITREEYAARVEEVYPSNPDAVQGGTFILADNSDINTTNAILMNNSPTIDIMGLVFQSLAQTDATGASYVPALADSWELADDAITWTFNLGQNITWHDGTPFTSADVLMSFDAQASPDTTSSYTGSFTDTVASWEAPDDHTVVMTSTRPFAPLVFFANSYCPIMAKHLWESVPFAEWRADPGSTGQDPSRVIGTGPMKFVEWVQGERTELAKNETYYGKVPNIDTLIFQIWPDEVSMVEALRAGEIDAMENVPPADTQSIADDENLDVEIFDTYSFTFYAYNMDPEKTPLFQDVEVRQALFYALDRQSIVDNIQLGYGEVAQGSQPKLSIAYAPDQIRTVYDYDPAKAAELLDSAGWVAGDDGVRAKDGNRLAFEVMYTGGIAIYDQLAPYMQEAWAEIGVEMTPNPVDFGSVLLPAVTETYDYQIAMLGFNWGISGDQTAMFSSTSYGDGFNLMKYSDPEVDQLNLDAQVELDPERRVEMLIESMNLVNDDLPVGIFWFSRNRDGHSVRIHDWNPNSFGQPDLTWNVPNLWIEE